MTDERRQELDELILNETNAPETQEWRDNLTAEEQEYVNSEDERYENVFNQVLARTYEENQRAKLIDYITSELDKDLLDSYETEFLRDLAKFIEEYGYI